MKKSFAIPFILNSQSGTKGGEIGGGTGQGGSDPIGGAMSFVAWAQSSYWQTYDQDYGDGDGIADMEEYGLWWADCEFTLQQWLDAGNSQADWTTYVAPHLN